MSPRRWNLARVFALGAGLLSCGGSPHAPILSGLSIEPSSGAKAGEALTVAANYIDDDGDLGGGQAEVALRRLVEPHGQTFETPLMSGSTRRGRLVIQLSLPVGLPPGTYELGLTAIDSTMRRSPGLTAEFEIIP
ncbi:MAG: hypothetical protein U1E65_08020 [Myxococcota bacterium]